MERRRQCLAVAAALLSLVVPVSAGTLVLETDPGTCEVQAGEQMTVLIRLIDLGADEAAGFQAFVEIDESRLTLVGGIYPDDPFGLPIIDPIANDGGLIALSSGIDRFAGQEPTSSDGIVAELTFDVAAGVGPPAIGFVNHLPPNRISDDQGNELPLLLMGEAPPSCRADFNGNGKVEITDLLVVLSNWNMDCPGDAFPDGVVNILDLVEVLTKWGECPTL